MDKYVWLTCAGTYREVQEEAMREYFPDVVGNLDYKEVSYTMDDYTDAIAISGNMDVEMFDKVIGTEDYETVAFKVYTIEEDDFQAIVDTVEAIEAEERTLLVDVHIYRSIKEIDGDKFHIYYAMDVNA